MGLFGGWVSTYSMDKNFVSNDVIQLFPSEESFDALASIIGCMDYGIAMARTDGKFVIWNRKAYQILGKRQADVGHENWAAHYGFYNPDTKCIIATEDVPLVKAIKGKHVDKQEILVINENMKDRIIVCDADPIIHDGNIMGGVTVFWDITKERQIELKMKDVLNKLEDLKNYQNKMLDSMSK